MALVIPCVCALSFFDALIIQGYIYQEKLQKDLKGTKVAGGGCRTGGGPSYLEALGSSGGSAAGKARVLLKHRARNPGAEVCGS